MTESKKEKEVEKVVLTREEFDALRADISLLKKATSRYKLEEQEAIMNKGEKRLPRGHLKRLNGKLVVKWLGVNTPGSQAKMEILYQGTTPAGEILKGHYITLEGESIVTDAVNFYRSNDLEKFTKIGTTPDGEWIIKFDNPDLPQEYIINVNFVNP